MPQNKEPSQKSKRWQCLCLHCEKGSPVKVPRAARWGYRVFDPLVINILKSKSIFCSPSQPQMHPLSTHSSEDWPLNMGYYQE